VTFLERLQFRLFLLRLRFRRLAIRKLVSWLRSMERSPKPKPAGVIRWIAVAGNVWAVREPRPLKFHERLMWSLCPLLARPLTTALFKRVWASWPARLTAISRGASFAWRPRLAVGTRILLKNWREKQG